MARGRLISKSLGSSRRFHQLLDAGGKLGEFCQVLFPLLVANSDDFGRLEADAFTVKHVVLPTSRRPEIEFAAALTVLQSCKLIDVYEIDGNSYLQIRQFDIHQPNLHKRTTSKFPEPPEDSGKVREIPPQSNIRYSGTQNPEENPEPGTQNPEPRVALMTVGAFGQFWHAYPKKTGKAEALKAFQKLKPSDALVARMIAAVGEQSSSVQWQREGGQFIPNPATWLRQGRWDDEVPQQTSMVSDVGLRNQASAAAALAFLEERDGR